ncbi:hypothetical protein F4604DRAFT_1685922 [Suillus subluteus]|nr:hypothetical protein F4604DRAFT_1685922 [Suillus subluteus]
MTPRRFTFVSVANVSTNRERTPIFPSLTMHKREETLLRELDHANLDENGQPIDEVLLQNSPHGLASPVELTLTGNHVTMANTKPIIHDQSQHSLSLKGPLKFAGHPTIDGPYRIVRELDRVDDFKEKEWERQRRGENDEDSDTSVFQRATRFLAPSALGGIFDHPSYAPRMWATSSGCVTATRLLAEHNSPFGGMLDRGTSIARYPKRPTYCHRVIRPGASHSVLPNSYEPTVQHKALENACHPRKPDPISNPYLSAPRPETVDSSFPLTSWR